MNIGNELFTDTKYEGRTLFFGTKYDQTAPC